ncbi:hypothetical protein EDD63_1784 [Breznakia blatticola]|uniref:Sigma factor regulator n=1 Tax=Breznakia blatticola TaxID=1754012 RepID=A0A4R7ZC17_9FIRM|nr:hypothetical protein [Breznakia blatticola]TDW08050.1 hypothetical protein EDD63_1784 [Breznakia blatticola]
MKKDEFDKMFEMKNDHSEDDKIIKETRLGLRKNIYNRIVVVCVILGVLITATVFGYRSWKTNSNFNPLKEEVVIKNESYDIFQYVLTAYVETTNSSGTYSFDYYDTKSILRNGLTEYSIYGRYNSFGLNRENNGIPTEIVIKDSKLISSTFDLNEDEHDYENKGEADVSWNYEKENYLETISELPKTARYDYSIRFKKPISYEQLSKLLLSRQSYSNNIDYACMYASDGKTLGLNLARQNRAIWTRNGRMNTDYDSASELKKYYKKQLEFLASQETVVKILGSSEEYKLIQEQLKIVESGESTILGIRVQSDADTLLRYINDRNTDAVYIKDVSLSYFDK